MYFYFSRLFIVKQVPGMEEFIRGIVDYSIAGHLYLYQYGYDCISHYSEVAVLLSVPASDHGRW